MPSDTDVLAQLDLDEPPQHLLDWAKENIKENPETRCMIVEEFRDTIYARGECTPHRTDDSFLLRFLRARKFNIEAAHRLLVNYYDFKECNHELFESVNLKYLLTKMNNIISVPPYREQTGRRILLYRMGLWNTDTVSVNEILQGTVAILELAILEPRAQILGGIGMFDLSGLTMNHAYYMTPTIAHIIIKIMVTSLPMKIHAVHLVFQPWVFDMVYNAFKSFLSSMMKERIFFHGDNMESLHRHIDPKHLPQRYGGVHPDYDYADWVVNLRKEPRIKQELISLGYSIEDEEYDEYVKSDSDCKSGVSDSE